MTRSDEDEFDRRLSLEIIPDAFGPEEQALSWYYYLEEHLQFPFEAECVSDRSTSPLRIGDKVANVFTLSLLVVIAVLLLVGHRFARREVAETSRLA